MIFKLFSFPSISEKILSLSLSLSLSHTHTHTHTHLSTLQLSPFMYSLFNVIFILFTYYYFHIILNSLYCLFSYYLNYFRNLQERTQQRPSMSFIAMMYLRWERELGSDWVRSRKWVWWRGKWDSESIGELYCILLLYI